MSKNEVDIACAVARIRQIWDEYQRTGEVRSDLLSRLATCDAPRLEALAARVESDSDIPLYMESK